MKAFCILPILIILIKGAQACGCSYDTIFLMAAMIMAGWMANDK